MPRLATTAPPPLGTRVLLCALVLGLVTGLGGCRGGRDVVPVAIGPAAAAGPRYPEDFGTHRASMSSVATILVRDLGLPLPAAVTAFVYSSREVFQQGLILDGRVSPVRAAELSDFAIGVGKRRQVLLHDDARGRRRGSEWLRLIAHELAHVAQIELAQGEGRADQWLAEGMAEWVAFAVLQRLGLDTLDERRAKALRGVLSHGPVVAGRLDLETLGTPRGYTLRHLREGALATYQLSFLMVDRLIEHHGFARLVDYFRSFAAGQDRGANFARAFGRTLPEFEVEMLAALAPGAP